TLTVSLNITHALRDALTISVYINVVNINLTPVANAGPDKTVSEGSSVGLNGAASSDPDGDTLSYSWTQTAGPNAPLSNSNTATPTLKTPSLNSSDSTLTYDL